jgi:hypothetical protein
MARWDDYMFLIILGILIFCFVILHEYLLRNKNNRNANDVSNLNSSEIPNPNSINVSKLNDNTHIPYSLNTSILTARESSFFEVLYPIATKHNLYVLIKPRIADFITVTVERYKKGSDFNKYFNQIAKKHIDFLICNKDFKPILGFEIDDKTHSKHDRIVRDSFVDGLYKSVGLPTFHLYNWNNPDEIEQHILSQLSNHTV